MTTPNDDFNYQDNAPEPYDPGPDSVGAVDPPLDAPDVGGDEESIAAAMEFNSADDAAESETTADDVGAMNLQMDVDDAPMTEAEDSPSIDMSVDEEEGGGFDLDIDSDDVDNSPDHEAIGEGLEQADEENENAWSKLKEAVTDFKDSESREREADRAQRASDRALINDRGGLSAEPSYSQRRGRGRIF